MYSERNDLNLTIFAPETFCTEEEWGVDCNLVTAFVQRNSYIPKEFDEIDVWWMGRRGELMKFLMKSPHSASTESLEVQIFSDNANFFPLLRIEPDTKQVSVLNDNDLLKARSQSSKSCPVVWAKEDLGIAAFILLPKSQKNLEVLWDAPQKNPEKYWGSSQQAIVQLIASGLIISEVQVGFDLTPNSSEFMETTSAKIYERVFASYAREDKAAVECVESIMQAFGMGELRWDLKVMQAGVNWQESVFDEIKIADSFQLFWSEHAKKSKNVRKEWNYALSLNRDRFVKPVYWIDPLPAPPKELKHIHFSRIKLIQ